MAPAEIGVRQRDVYVLHLTMGTVMAAMLGHLLPTSMANLSALSFLAGVAWFGAKAVHRSTGRLLDLQHALACLAMVAMLAAITAPVSATSVGRAGHGSHLALGAQSPSMSTDHAGALSWVLVIGLAACVAANVYRAVRTKTPSDGRRDRRLAGTELAMTAVMGLMVTGVV
jgi:hypothetical protein